ncbi:unnamed protein product [Soboliphyme baturini]|uniref:Uncharacterized protein n=1 Tax=Soboliphyme baturini TaxID=241478 RepID=A0A3P8FF70_9BILA|nr:unnamed protein product [Soboliphyme baturini]
MIFLEADVNEISRKNGYPRTHPHKLCSLRQELIDAFLEYRYIAFVKMAASYLQKLRVNNDGDMKNSAEVISPVKNMSGSSKNVGVNGFDNNAIGDERFESIDGTKATTVVNGEIVNELLSSVLMSSLKASSQLFAPSAVSKAAALGNLELSFLDGSKSSSLNDALPEMNCYSDVTDIVQLYRDKENGSNCFAASCFSCLMASVVFLQLNWPPGKLCGVPPKRLDPYPKQVLSFFLVVIIFYKLNFSEFDIRFNPDCYSSTVTHSDDENLQAQQQVVKDAAEFLLTSQIPNFVISLRCFFFYFSSRFRSATALITLLFLLTESA